jgi:hypothetical protein
MHLKAGEYPMSNGSKTKVTEVAPDWWSLSYTNTRGIAIMMLVVGLISMIAGFLLIWISMRTMK